jgi:hypothetical protein
LSAAHANGSLPRVNEFKPLIHQLYREEIARAMERTLEENFRGTFELTDFAFRLGRDGVAADLPQATAEEREREWQRRLRIVRWLDEQGIYAPSVEERAG